ncbi:glycosyltransferase [Bacteroides sp.]
MKYCCLIVTYNRINLLCRCIDACLSQDVKPDVIVFNNASNDGTKETLNELSESNNRLKVIHSKDNIGGAGGFSNGLKYAINNGYDFVWMMDDDGYPRHDHSMLECIKLYESLQFPHLVNAFVYADNGTLSFKIGGCANLNEIDAKFADSDIYDSIAPFNGTLVTREIVERIGYPIEKFFIKGDEAEYVIRAKRNNIGWVTARKAEFYHPRFLVGTVKFFSKEFPLNEEPAWKEYCRARNYAFIQKKYFGTVGVFKLFLISILKCLTYKTDRTRKIQATFSGLKHGLVNKFSNDIIFKYR